MTKLISNFPNLYTSYHFISKLSRGQLTGRSALTDPPGLKEPGLTFKPTAFLSFWLFANVHTPLRASQLVGIVDYLTDQVMEKVWTPLFHCESLGSNNFSISLMTLSLCIRLSVTQKTQEAAKDNTQLCQKLAGKADEKQGSPWT